MINKYTVIALLAAFMAGCSSTDSSGIPAFKTTNPYSVLLLNVRAVVMSTVPPYDTLQLIPTAYDANGNVIPLPGPVTYTVNDTTLKVSPTGLVTLLHKPGSSAQIIASVQDTTLYLTRTDTVFISGTTTVPSSPLASFSIQPATTDSAILDIKNGTKTLTVTALDATGTAISKTALKLHFQSENVTVATINATSGVVTTVTPGVARLVASTTYYGVTKTDSLQFRSGYPDTTTLSLIGTPTSGGGFLYYWNTNNLIVGVNKTVIFAVQYFYNLVFNNGALFFSGNIYHAGDRTINESASAVFDDSAAVVASPASATVLAKSYASNGSGNVSIQIPDSVVVVDSVNGTSQYSMKLFNYCKGTGFPCATARSFATPGTYHYTNPATGASGTITVVAP